jgi:hypothetical protein
MPVRRAFLEGRPTCYRGRRIRAREKDRPALKSPADPNGVVRILRMALLFGVVFVSLFQRIEKVALNSELSLSPIAPASLFGCMNWVGPCRARRRPDGQQGRSNAQRVRRRNAIGSLVLGVET